MTANLGPLRFACRTLIRSQWYAFTAIGTITLTIALSATVFAVVDGVLFKPLPYLESDRLFQVVGLSGAALPPELLSSADLGNLSRADSRIRVTAFANGLSLTHPDRPDATIWSARIAADFFDVLGQGPLVGGFTQADFAAIPVPGLPRAAIVTHSFWRQRLASDPAAVGQPSTCSDKDSRSPVFFRRISYFPSTTDAGVRRFSFQRLHQTDPREPLPRSSDSPKAFPERTPRTGSMRR